MFNFREGSFQFTKSEKDSETILKILFKMYLNSLRPKINDR